MSVSFFIRARPNPDIYTLSLHDALPIFGVPLGRPKMSKTPSVQVSRLVLRSHSHAPAPARAVPRSSSPPQSVGAGSVGKDRSEEHTSELQSRLHLVCRLLLEKKKKSLNI